MSLNDILSRHRITHLPKHQPDPNLNDHQQLWAELGVAQERAMRQGNWNTVEHFNRERNRLWYQFIMPDDAYRTLPKSIQILFPR